VTRRDLDSQAGDINLISRKARVPRRVLASMVHEMVLDGPFFPNSIFVTNVRSASRRYRARKGLCSDISISSFSSMGVSDGILVG
jgi:hypothetical protein